MMDVVILVVVLIGIARGFFTGGIRQLLSLVGVVVALLLAVRFSERVGEYLIEFFDLTEHLAPIAAFIGIFSGIQVTVFLLARLLESFLKVLKLSMLNRLLGSAFGGFKAVLVLSLFLFVFRYAGIPDEEMRNRSLLYENVYPILPATWEFIEGKVPPISQ